MTSNKGVSSIVTTVLIILVAIFAVALIWASVSLFFNNFKNSSSPLFSSTKFQIEPMTSQDLLLDRFKIRNTGQTVLIEYRVSVDGVRKELVVQKRIEPQEEEYLFFKEPISFGEHNLVVSSNGYIQNIVFNINQNNEWHVTITNVSVG